MPRSEHFHQPSMKSGIMLMVFWCVASGWFCLIWESATSYWKLCCFRSCFRPARGGCLCSASVTALLLAPYGVRAGASYTSCVKSRRHRRCSSYILAAELSLGTRGRVTVCPLTAVCKVGWGHLNVYKLLFTTSCGTRCVFEGKSLISNSHVTLYVHFEQLDVLGTV